MASRPLIVAGVAAALLVVVLAVDLSFNRSYALDLRQDDAWVQVAEFPFPRYDEARGPDSGPAVDPNGTVEMRVRVDNGYPMEFSKSFALYVGGTRVGDGLLTAPALGEGEAIVTFPASTLFRNSDPLGPPGVEGEGSTAYAWVRLEIGSDTWEQSLFVRSVAS